MLQNHVNISKWFYQLRVNSTGQCQEFGELCEVQTQNHGEEADSTVGLVQKLCIRGSSQTPLRQGTTNFMMRETSSKEAFWFVR